jgi:hypothetical protein
MRKVLNAADHYLKEEISVVLLSLISQDEVFKFVQVIFSLLPSLISNSNDHQLKPKIVIKDKISNYLSL